MGEQMIGPASGNARGRVRAPEYYLERFLNPAIPSPKRSPHIQDFKYLIFHIGDVIYLLIFVPPLDEPSTGPMATSSSGRTVWSDLLAEGQTPMLGARKQDDTILGEPFSYDVSGGA